jgi:hypothetical protein
MRDFFVGSQFRHLKEVLQQSQFRKSLMSVGPQLQFRNRAFVILLDGHGFFYSAIVDYLMQTDRQVADR